MAAGLVLPADALSAEIVDRVVAVVNNDVIPLYELNQAARPYIERIKSSQYPNDVQRKLLFEVRQKVLDELINEKLTDQELQRLKISVSEKEVDNTIERMKEAQSMTDEKLRQLLNQEGMTMEEYRQNAKKQLLRARLVTREVRSKVVITQEDIKTYYENHRAEYAGEKKYHLRNIYIRIPTYASEEDRSMARRAMENIALELEGGKRFESFAETSFDAPAVAEGDDLGFFKLDELAPQLQDAIKNKKAGEFTQILEADFGYQIVYIEEIVESGGKSLEEASPEIQDKLYKEIVDREFTSWLQALHDRSHIKIIN